MLRTKSLVIILRNPKSRFVSTNNRYLDEMNGDFNPQVIPEDISDEGFIDPGLFPNYTRILRDTKGGQELLKQEKERNLGVGSSLSL